MARDHPQSSDDAMIAQVGARSMLHVCLIGSAAFVIISLCNDVMKYNTDLYQHIGPFARVTPLLDIDEEVSLPTIFSFLMLLGCAVSATLISRIDAGAHAKRWLGLALLFALLAFDEVLMLHEKSMKLPIVIGGLIIMATGIHRYPQFLKRLHGKTLALLVSAGIVYLSGAAVIDEFSGSLAEAHGREVLSYRLLATLEEALEFAGVTLAVAALQNQLGHLGVEGFRLGSSVLPIVGEKPAEGYGALAMPSPSKPG